MWRKNTYSLLEGVQVNIATVEINLKMSETSIYNYHKAQLCLSWT